jgi:hypothetical protein
VLAMEDEGITKFSKMKVSAKSPSIKTPQMEASPSRRVSCFVPGSGLRFVAMREMITDGWRDTPLKRKAA